MRTALSCTSSSNENAVFPVDGCKFNNITQKAMWQAYDSVMMIGRLASDMVVRLGESRWSECRINENRKWIGEKTRGRSMKQSECDMRNSGYTK